MNIFKVTYETILAGKRKRGFCIAWIVAESSQEAMQEIRDRSIEGVQYDPAFAEAILQEVC